MGGGADIEFLRSFLYFSMRCGKMAPIIPAGLPNRAALLGQGQASHAAVVPNSEPANEAGHQLNNVLGGVA